MNAWGVSVAGVQTLGAPLALDIAREADELGYASVWVAEANAAEAGSMLGAVSQVAPRVGLGTGVLALQLRTPPLHAMAAATLQQLAEMGLAAEPAADPEEAPKRNARKG